MLPTEKLGSSLVHFKRFDEEKREGRIKSLKNLHDVFLTLGTYNIAASANLGCNKWTQKEK